MQREFSSKQIQLKNDLGDDTKDLMRNMLKIDSNDRCDIDWILNHPAITKNKERFRQPISEQEFATLIRNFMINTKGTEGRDMPEALSDFMNIRQQNMKTDFFSAFDFKSPDSDEIPRKSMDYRMFDNNQGSNQYIPQDHHAPRGQIFERLSNMNHVQSKSNISNTGDIYSLNNTTGVGDMFLKPGAVNTKKQAETINTTSQLNLNSGNNYTNLRPNNVYNNFSNQENNVTYNRAPYDEQRGNLLNSTQFQNQATDRAYDMNNTTNLPSNLQANKFYNQQSGTKIGYGQPLGTNTTNISQQMQIGNNQFGNTANQFGMQNTINYRDKLQQTTGNTIYTRIIQNPGSNRNIGEGYAQNYTKSYEPNQVITTRRESGAIKQGEVSYELPTSRDSGNRLLLNQTNNITTKRYTFEQPRQQINTAEMTTIKPQETKVEINRGQQPPSNIQYIYKEGLTYRGNVEREREVHRPLTKAFSTVMAQPSIQQSTEGGSGNDRVGFKNYVFTQSNRVVKLEDNDRSRLNTYLAQNNMISSNTRNLSSSDLTQYRNLINNNKIPVNALTGQGTSVNPPNQRYIVENSRREVILPQMTKNFSFTGMSQVRRL